MSSSFEAGTAPVRAPSSGDCFVAPGIASKLAGPEKGKALPFPSVGDRFDDCLLLAELGRGAEGRVFLAAQTALEDRPIVLKVTPLRGGEHLSLARVLHTNIVPLLYVHDFPDAGLRVLAMPYVGGDALSHILNALMARPHRPSSGREIFEQIDRLGANRPTTIGLSRPLRDRLAGISFVAFVAWVGASLADALAHAHERGLVHLDIKPGNVLIAADGQPLLLDFHLAGAILPAGSSQPVIFGGSWGYMAPEQQRASEAFLTGKPNPVGVDGRADVYALGVVLFEMLTSVLPEEASPIWLERRLRQSHPEVTSGLVDIVLRCLARDPAHRYPRMTDLADDLRRHLTHQPLRGVPNRDLGERWRKWRRRNPSSLVRVALAGLVFVAFAAGLALAGRSILDRRQVVLDALSESHRLTQSGALAEAAHLLERTTAPAGWPGATDLATQLRAEQQAAHARLSADRFRLHRERLAADLARLANNLRLSWAVDRLSAAQARQCEKDCNRVWAQRKDLLQPRLSPDERDDLLELVLVRASLRWRLAASPEASRRETLALLDEAERTLGPNATLAAERQRLSSGDLPDGTARLPVSAIEHYWAGRLLLRAGRLEAALGHFVAAGQQRPDAFWPCFYRGLCAHRLGRFDEADTAFQICLALMPRSAEVNVNRASAQAALGRLDAAQASLDRALALNPGLGQAWLQRGLLNAKAKRFADAIHDLERGLETGADPGACHFNLAVIYREKGDRRQARRHIEQAIEIHPDDAEALRLRRQLVDANESSLRR